MVHRQERNEFGLDEYNYLDVQKERAKDFMPWVFAGLALLAIFSAITAASRRAY
jgi:hypothetical protein